MPAIRHVIWDFNGTLLDDLELCLDIVNTMLREAELPALSTERYRQVFDFPVRAYYERLGFDVTGRRFNALADRFIGDYRQRVHGCDLHAGVAETLARLTAQGITHSVLSAARQSLVSELLAKRTLLTAFTDVVGLDDDHATSKLGRAQAWLSLHSLVPDGWVLVGDTVHDAEVAAALGIPCALVSVGHQSRSRLSATGCPIYDDFESLANALEA